MSQVIRETSKFVVTRGYNNSEERHRRFRCVGGPNDGEMRAGPELNLATRAGQLGYRRFNNAGGSVYSMIYVWIE